MKLQIGVTATGLDLAAALDGDQGTFVCQQGGQTYLVGAKEGHSISYGPTPIGVRVVEANTSNSLSPEPWKITKIADNDITAQFRQQTQRRNLET